MPVTVNDVITQARKDLLDIPEVTGTLYSDSQYLPFLHSALDELTKTVRLLGNWKLIRDRVFPVSANTSFLDLEYAFPGLGVLLNVWGQVPTASPSSISASTGGGTGLYTLTIPSNAGLAPGTPVAIFGTGTALDGAYTISALVGGTQVQVQALTGLIVTAGYLAPLAGWGNPWPQIEVMPDLTSAPWQPGQWYCLDNGGLNFPPAPQDRLLRARYALGAWQTPGLTDKIELLDGFNVLAQLLALKAGSSLQMDPDRLAALHSEIYGEPRSGKLGSMKLLSRHMSLTTQNTQFVRPRWRRRPVPAPSIITN